MFTPSQPASQSYVELRSALADFLIFLDRLRSAKKCASGPLLPDFLMPIFKCTFTADLTHVCVRFLCRFMYLSLIVSF